MDGVAVNDVRTVGNEVCVNIWYQW